jgi:hypothetical protein
MEKSMLDGVFVFRGKPTPIREAGGTLDAAVRTVLSAAVKEVFPHFHLAPVRPSTDEAAKFLGVERMDRITKDIDSLGLVVKGKGAPRVDAPPSSCGARGRASRCARWMVWIASWIPRC